MKHVFVINPVSGKGQHNRRLVPAIENFIEQNPNENISIKYTCGEKDATILASLIAGEAGEEKMTVFACGGDGTIQEVAAGLYGHENATLGIVPIGSGNDFARALCGKNAIPRLLDFDKQLNGNEIEIDLLQLSYEFEGQNYKRIVVNGVNIGIDGDIAIKMPYFKRVPGVSGHFAYLLSVVTRLVKKEGQNLRITCDDKVLHEGELLLVTAANGGYCGGGVLSCPHADLQNGKIEVQAIMDIQRKSFASLFPKYKAGRIEEIRNYNKIVKYTRAENIVIEPLKDKTMAFVADGEIVESEALNIDILPNAMKVLIAAE